MNPKFGISRIILQEIERTKKNESKNSTFIFGMSIGLSQEDIDLVRSYVTARDGHEYDYVEDGVVCFDITHNYLKVRMHSVHMPITSTVCREDELS